MFLNKNKNKYENFCYIPDVNPYTGTLNDKEIVLDEDLPESKIKTSSCDKYWKEWPLEYNSTMVDDEPIMINDKDLQLPKEKNFSDNSYKAGFIDFTKLSELISNKTIDTNFNNDSEELFINPITKEKFQYKYELDNFYFQHNQKTGINRWNKYNPNVKTNFEYEEIKSSMENINLLNQYFIEKCNTMQKQFVEYKTIEFQIFKYKLLTIKYKNKNIQNPIYTIQITLFRELDLYMNTFSYIGFIKDNNKNNNQKNDIIIFNVEYIGRNSKDTFLLTSGYNKNEQKYKNFNDFHKSETFINNHPDTILKIIEEQKEEYKLKNHYACFNIENNDIIKYESKEMCESKFDNYGKEKTVGMYDTPCKKNEDCPFYKKNKNYKNEFGKCMKNGFCQLPLHMNRLGYRYYMKNEKPLCYNCNTSIYQYSTDLDFCCDEQLNKKKYSFLHSPDFAFSNDNLQRMNEKNKNDFLKDK
jgi:hypothetical protein